MPRPPFPHMMPRDVPLFAGFVLNEPPGKWDRWVFDHRLGQGHIVGFETDPAILKLSLEVSRLRVDAIGFQGGFPTLFEVKPSARLSAYGQIKAYQLFYEKEFFVLPAMAIITDSITPDTAWLFAREGIAVHIVKPADLQGIIRACYLVKANCDQLIRIPGP